MNGQSIIDKFNLDTDDSSELSDSESLDLANDVYGDICDDRDWEWLKKTFTGVMSITVPYIALPTDFKKFVPNLNGSSEVLIGTTYNPYKIIPFSSRREHVDQDGYAYLDVPNQRIVFLKQPTSASSIEFDYIMIQPDLTLATEPLFRVGFHPMIAFGMAARFPAIEQADKLTSYASEYNGRYNDQLHDLAMEDAYNKLSI